MGCASSLGPTVCIEGQCYCKPGSCLSNTGRCHTMVEAKGNSSEAEFSWLQDSSIAGDAAIDAHSVVYLTIALATIMCTVVALVRRQRNTLTEMPCDSRQPLVSA